MLPTALCSGQETETGTATRRYTAPTQAVNASRQGWEIRAAELVALDKLVDDAGRIPAHFFVLSERKR
jgi:hypothetical protein